MVSFLYTLYSAMSKVKKCFWDISKTKQKCQQIFKTRRGCNEWENQVRLFSYQYNSYISGLWISHFTVFVTETINKYTKLYGKKLPSVIYSETTFIREFEPVCFWEKVFTLLWKIFNITG